MALAAAPLAAWLAAGVLVEGAASAELRAGGAQADGEVDPLAQLDAVTAVQATPSLRAAVEAGANAARASYAVQLSGIPAPASVALFHRGDAGFELQLAPLVRTRGTLAVSGGQLDPLQAQLTLVDTGTVATDQAALPYLSADADVVADLRLTRRVRLETGVEASTVTIGDSAQAMHQGAVRVATMATLSRNDEGVFAVTGLAARRGASDDGDFDGAQGASATAGLVHRVLRDTNIGAELGAVALALTRGDELGATVVRPIGALRAATLLGLGGERALVANGALAVDVAPNPGGGVAETRVTASSEVEARLATGIAVTISASGFAPGRVVGGAPLAMVPLGQAALAGAWSVSDHVQLGGALVVTGSALPTGARLEGIVATLGVRGSAELWHAGGRPRGASPIVGAELGVAPVGTTAAPGMVTPQEPAPPPVVETPPPTPPELVPPAVQQPMTPPPPPPPVHLPPAKRKPRPSLLPAAPSDDVTDGRARDAARDVAPRDDDGSDAADGDDDDDQPR